MENKINNLKLITYTNRFGLKTEGTLLEKYVDLKWQQAQKLGVNIPLGQIIFPSTEAKNYKECDKRNARFISALITGNEELIEKVRASNCEYGWKIYRKYEA